MVMNAEQKCLLWLSNAEVSAGHVQKLMEVYGCAEGIWEAFDKPEGPRFPAAAHTILKATHSPAAIEVLAEKLEHKNINLLFQNDSRYPALLSAIQDPPYLLYYAGRLSCFEKPVVALVGTRNPSRYGIEMAEHIAADLAKAEVCVVSGLARGIDAAVHRAVLDAGGCTVGVLGSGINVPYPPEHRSMLRKIAGGIGLVISEYPMDAPPVAYHFPHRNRIISGLSIGTVFVEGKIKSGGMHTVHAALEQGREVFAVPGQVGHAGSEGPHAILREGARMITSAQDLLEDLGLNTPAFPPVEQKKIKLNEVQREIFAQLRLQELTPQEIADATSIDVGKIVIELGTLEIEGVVKREAGNRFHLPLSAR